MEVTIAVIAITAIRHRYHGTVNLSNENERKGNSMKKSLNLRFVTLLACAMVLIVTAGRLSAKVTWPPAGVTGTAYYISTAGSDVTGNGSQSKPWASITYADSHIGPGAVVHVMPGTYNWGATGDYGIYTMTSGTSSQPVTWLSDTLGAAKINCNPQPYYLWSSNGNYVNIYGFDMTGVANWNNAGSDFSVALTCGGTNCNVGWMTIHDLGTAVGVAIDMCPGGGYTDGYYTCHDNTITNCGSASSGYCGYGIYGAGCGYIYNNLITHCGAYGITNWHASSGTKICNNTFDTIGYISSSNCWGIGILVGTGSGGAEQGACYQVWNNNCTNCYVGILAEQSSPGTINSGGTYFYNNLCYNNTGYIYFDNNGTWTNLIANSSGFVLSQNITGENPLYVNAPTYNYHLQGTAAPGWATGYTYSYTPTWDLDGDAVRTPPAIGCYENTAP